MPNDFKGLGFSGGLPINTDYVLAQVLRGHPRLRCFKLASCNQVTDVGLACLPPTLQELNLVCCGSVRGSCLQRFTRLAVLRLSSCQQISGDSISKVKFWPLLCCWVLPIDWLHLHF